MILEVVEDLKQQQQQKKFVILLLDTGPMGELKVFVAYQASYLQSLLQPNT